MFFRRSIIIVCIAGGLQATAQEQPSLQKRADAHYQRQEYAPAAALYEVIVRKKPSVEIMQKLATAYRAVNQYEAAAGWYEKLLQQPGAASINKRYYGDMLKSMGQYEAAKVQYKSWSTDSAALLINGCDSAIAWLQNPAPVQWVDLAALNTANSDWGPVKYGKQLVFVSDRGMDKRTYKRNKHPFLKLYVADDRGYVSTFNQSMDHFPYHSGPVCFSKNQDTAWLTVTYPWKVNFEKAERPAVYGNRRLALLTYVRKGATWTLSGPFPYNNVAAFSVGHAAISNDGSTLYYTSDQPGGVGQTDLWYSTRMADGSWGAPVNCGPQINTTEAEEFPVIAPDGTLYFSSMGHVGMGGFDVFAAHGEGKQWSTPENMRAPLNSSADDFSMMIDEGSRGYLSSNRKGGKGDDDIYSFMIETRKTPSAQLQPDRTILILAATVLDKTNNNPVPDAFTLIKQPPQDRQWTQITPADGTNYLVLNSDSKYTAEAYKGARKAFPVEVSTAGRTTSDTIRVTLYLDAPAVAESLAIENIYYDFNKSFIRTDAAAILDKLAALLQEHPSATVLLTAHTDARGSDAYNIALSRQRAVKAKEYLLQKGILSGRISTDFQGKRTPSDNCDPCNEAQHQSNRRTNIQILKK